MFIFQQDGAPAHTARSAQEWLRANCPDFVAKDQWPPNSPDLNPLDYHVWGAMLEASNKAKNNLGTQGSASDDLGQSATETDRQGC